jgi:phosphoglycolate phosphatase-like HAD superfamily hydrolase
MRETPFGQVRAIGFDLDDTLCAYMPAAVQARRAIMQRYLVPPNRAAH